VTFRIRRKIMFGLLFAPLALGLAACSGDADGDAAKTSDPIPKIAPPEGKSWTDIVEKTEEGGYRMGNPDAPIKLVEFGALSCSHCAHFSEEASAEIAEDFVASGRVNFELRHFILNPYDIAASLLATCGTKEAVIPLSEQFWAWQPNMFQNVQNAGEAQLQAIDSQPPGQRFASFARVTGMDEFFAARGIAADQGAACLADSDKVTEMVDRTRQASEEFGITGTPAFLINGQNAEVNTWPEIKTRLENLGAR